MRYILIILPVFFIMSSCSGDASKDNVKTYEGVDIRPKGGRNIIDANATSDYVGKPGRLIIVSENTIYTKEIQHVFDSVFNTPIEPYYPRTTYFDVFHKKPSDFTGFFVRMRNIIQLTIDKKIEKGNPQMLVYKNYNARTQLFTKLKAHDINDLYGLIIKEIGYLFKVYDRQEWLREYFRNNDYKHTVTNQKLKEKFGINLVLPKKFNYESIDDTYAIIRFPNRSKRMEFKTDGGGTQTRMNYIQSGIMIWQYPYTDTAQLNPDNLMEMRDTILKKYALHEMKGVYMGTQYHPAALPVYEKLKIGTARGYQIKGLYKFTGAAEPSGGRFWGFQFKHPYRNKIVAISGYFHVPPTISPKLIINEIRSVIYSLEVVK